MIDGDGDLSIIESSIHRNSIRNRELFCDVDCTLYKVVLDVEILVGDVVLVVVAG